jgi:putative sigma-54 modulation protein
VQVSVVGRHVAVTEDVKDYAREKADKLPRFYDRIQHVEVILDRESDLFLVEMIAKAAGSQSFVAKESGPDIRACIDLIVEKIERQLKKHKERWRNRKHLGKKVEPAEES